MTSNSPCISTSPCESSPCASPVAERPRYYPRQIITPDDLTLEQEYFRNKLRRHNRLIHGWGVVCGAKVCRTPLNGAPAGSTAFQPWMVTVTSGYILGPYGDEILIDCCKTVDVRSSGSTGVTGDPCVQPTDPWCTEVFVQRDATAPLYVAVKYKECKTRPVRVQPVGCGCNDNTCEYSRLQDGYEIGILTSCPDEGDTPPTDLNAVLQGGAPDCPDCPPQPWVVLAQVTVASDGSITFIDNCHCRRIVASFAGYWRECAASTFTITGVAPSAGGDVRNIPVNAKDVTVVATVPGIDTSAAMTANLGAGITVNSAKPTAKAGEVAINFDVMPGAQTGMRTLIVSSGGASAAMPNAINIVPLTLKTAVSNAPAAPAAAETGAATADTSDASNTAAKKKKT